MRGRIFSIKKTTILRLSFIINLILYFTSVVLSFTTLKVDNLWFFSFCVFLGLQLVVKSILFYQDSSCFFGVILFLIGGFYFFCFYLGLLNLYIVYLLISIAFSSLVTYHYFKQPFQLAIALSLFFASLFTFIFIINLVTIPIFLALLVGDVLLLVNAYFMLL